MTLRNSKLKIFIFIFLCFLACVYIYPIFEIVNISLKSKMEYLNDPASLVAKPELGNFFEAWAGANMSSNFFNSIIYTAVSSLILGILSVFMAFPLARKKVKYHKILMSILTASLIIPPSLIPLYSIMKGLKFTDTYYGMILFYIGSGMALSVFILNGFMNMIPRELDEAAEMDGCGYFEYVFQIIIPLSKSALATVFMLNALNVWNDFVYPFLFLTKKDMRTLSTGLFNFVGQFQSDMGVLAAAVIIIAIPITILYVLMQKQITESLVQGAVKG